MTEFPLDAETGNLEATIIEVAIHRAGVNPVFGEEVIPVSIDDESGGPSRFVVSERSASGQRRRTQVDVEGYRALLKRVG